MSNSIYLAVLLLLLLAAGLRASPEHTVILVSLDGYAHTYLDRPEAAHLRQFGKEGVRAKALLPVFPTKTFPNHYSIATGLYPDHHGILANAFYDPVFKATFDLKDRSSVEDARWWGGEPIWVTAHRQHLRTATLFWPGSEAPISGVRPDTYRLFEAGVPPVEQIRRTFELLDGKEPPHLILVYLGEPDAAAHKFGPNSPEVSAAIKAVDAAVAQLTAGLASRKRTASTDVIVVSDHGMTELSTDRVIYLDDYVNVSDIHVVDWSPVTFIRPNPGKEEEIFQKLKGKHPHYQVYRKGELPERLHLKESRRITPVVGIADEGWAVAKHPSKAGAGKGKGRQPELGRRGAHGYDDSLPSMWGIFVASGPSFRQGLVTEPFLNIHVYELLCRLLAIKPAANDGRLDVVLPLLVSPNPKAQ